MKPMCPDCGKDLFFQQVARASKVTKINKDGSLSKRSSFIINGEDSDIIYLSCNGCGFNYSLTYKQIGEEEIKEFDEWFDKEYLK
ncbi:hypothetical protein [uncultured Clostridium sp.]|uniref:hypothetical protein n=1 Tax=uncultured Clostridium sp. TaxID=59620 RepID=UPI0028E6D967|nr:hypothetical protein [uncultured Clostridium sp.]